MSGLSLVILVSEKVGKIFEILNSLSDKIDVLDKKVTRLGSELFKQKNTEVELNARTLKIKEAKVLKQLVDSKDNCVKYSSITGVNGAAIGSIIARFRDRNMVLKRKGVVSVLNKGRLIYKKFLEINKNNTKLLKELK